MPISNYPNGFSQGLNVRGLPLLNTYSGDVYWLDSATGSDGNKGTFDRPFATLDYAIGRCTANNGDLIMIKANHAETITGAGGITADVAGVSIIGIGTGAQRPRFLMDGATTVTFVVSADDVYIENLVFAGGHNGIVTCFGVTGANTTIVGCEAEDNTADEHFLAFVTATSTTDNTADGLTLVGNKWYSADSGALYMVNTAADIANLTMKENLLIADAATGIVFLNVAAGKSLQGIDVGYNKIVCGNTAGTPLGQSNQADNTGIVYNNYVRHHDVAAATLVDIDGVGLFENHSNSTDDTSGALEPAADSIT